MAHKTYIICIGGFRQGTGERSGLFRLWMQLSKLRGPNTSTDLYKWNTKWPDVAEQIWLASEGWKKPRIVVACYSYGGGFGFLQLAKELGERGLAIETAVLSDAVYRSRFLLGKWLAFVPWPVIRVPKNVRNVHWFFQRESLPKGHRVVAVNTQRTKIDPPDGVQIEASHLYLDDAPEFWELVQKVAEAAVIETAIDQSVTEQAVAQQRTEPS